MRLVRPLISLFLLTVFSLAQTAPAKPAAKTPAKPAAKTSLAFRESSGASADEAALHAQLGCAVDGQVGRSVRGLLSLTRAADGSRTIRSRRPGVAGTSTAKLHQREPAVPVGNFGRGREADAERSAVDQKIGDYFARAWTKAASRKPARRR